MDVSYTQLKWLHVACAALSICLFVLRAGLALAEVNWRRWAWLRVLPHANDSLLLGAAIALAVWSGQAPWSTPWLAAKLLTLLAYIALGRLALQPQRSRASRCIYTALALLSVAYIVGAALSKSVGLGVG